MKIPNTTLARAKKNKKDEFYTLYEDIEEELSHYTDQLKGKRVYLNADNPEKSEFFRYFKEKFNDLDLQSLTATYYEPEENEPSYKWTITKQDNKITKTKLASNGDFRSRECLEILKDSDIVITNPPFSLFREHIAQLVEHNKDFILWSTLSAMTCKEIFPLFKDGKIRAGYLFNKEKKFKIPDDYEQYDKRYTEKRNDGFKYAGVPAICVFTTLAIDKQSRQLDFTNNHYTEEQYPKYDNYNAVECSEVKRIPEDYEGIIGVPVTYLGYHDPEKFNIIGLARYTVPKEALKGGRLTINGKQQYARVLIQKKKTN